MSSRSTSGARSCRGFTLIEATVAITILVIVLMVSGVLLFTLKNFATREQSFVEPRQTARRAVDYIAYYLRGASDMNGFSTAATLWAPNALIMKYNVGGVSRQATYNNVAVAGLADAGTDVITLCSAQGATLVQVSALGTSTGGSPGQPVNASNAVVNYSSQCGTGDPQNMAGFQALTGASGGQSNLLTMLDSQGNWAYSRITAYNSSNCANASTPPQIISVNTSNTIGGSVITSPGPITPNATPSYIAAGLQYSVFRVSTDTDPITGSHLVHVPRLQQKNGILNLDLAAPATATPDNSATAASFTTLLENVEDLQIVYIFANGEIWNNGTAANPAGHTLANGIPDQVGPSGGAPGVYDVTNVVALRVTVTARSSKPIPVYMQLKSAQKANLAAIAYTRPRAEDNPKGPPPVLNDPNNNTAYFHSQMSSTVIIRNRMLGS